MDNRSARIHDARRWSAAGSLLRVADGQDTPSKRPAAPHLGGPLGSSGAAPEDPPPAAGKPAEKEGAGSPSSEASGAGPGTPEKATDLPAGKTGKPGDKAVDNAGKPAEKPADNGEKPTDKPSADNGKKPTDKADDKAGDKTAGNDKSAAARSGEKPSGGAPAPSATAVALASRSDRATRVLRKANPVRVARSTSDWAKRPAGRFILPAIIAVLLLGAAGTAGAYLVPRALESVPTPSATPGFGLDAQAPAGPLPSVSGAPSLPGLTSAPVPPLGGGLPTTAPAGVGGARPADVLAGWAQQTGTRVGIPVVAVQAYGYAELVVGRTAPSCHLSWTTLAAIAKVESAHGSANGAVLGVDGAVAPAIFGLPLDGKGGRQLIADTDQGVLDKDTQFDRAMGPLQFIPQTWKEISAGNAVDADNNGVSDPNDIDDASLAAAAYLCRGGRDLSKADAWWEAILSYNAVRPYAQKVFDAANEYGQRSRA